MPRFNVEHNGKWACFSAIVDAFITPFMDKGKYEAWRLAEYGQADYVPAEQCNMMSIGEVAQILCFMMTEKEAIENLVESNLSESEARELVEKYKRCKSVKEQDNG